MSKRGKFESSSSAQERALYAAPVSRTLAVGSHDWLSMPLYCSLRFSAELIDGFELGAAEGGVCEVRPKLRVVLNHEQWQRR